MANIGTCAYCGLQKELTKDHVPPKILLDKPLPDNLWTVPACQVCNLGFKSDDEYTRTILARDLRANWNNAAQVNLPIIERSLARPEARGFAVHLRSQSTRMRVVTAGGAPIEMLEPNRARINRTGSHLLRGLYYREVGKRLSDTTLVRLECKAGLAPDGTEVQTMAKALFAFSDRRDGALGTAFSYMAGIASNMSVWGMLLYEYFWWVATIDEREEDEREKKPSVPSFPDSEEA